MSSPDPPRLPEPSPHVPERGPERAPERPGSVVARTGERLRERRHRNIENSRPLPEWVRRLAWVLDDAFEVPGLGGRRVGVDGLIALVPVVGDAAGIALGVIIVIAGIGAGVSIPTLLRMMLNVGIEALMGLIPFVGAVFDMAYKANNRNVALIEADLADRAATRRSSIRALVLSVVAVIVAFVMMVATVIAVIAVLIWLFSRWF